MLLFLSDCAQALLLLSIVDRLNRLKDMYLESLEISQLVRYDDLSLNPQLHVARYTYKSQC